MWLGGLFFFQAEDGIRDLVRSRGLGDVYKRQLSNIAAGLMLIWLRPFSVGDYIEGGNVKGTVEELSLIHI